MSILNVDKVQPIGGGSTITVDATDIQASTGTIRASTFSGDVSATGIGVTSLNVTGVTTFTGAVTSSSAVTAHDYRSGGGVGNTLYLTSADDWRFRTTGSAEKVRITSSGSVNIGGDYTQTTYKLKVSGTSYFSDNVAFTNGKGLDFSAASNLISGRGTSTSHILHDYEEGDYTPTFTAQSGTVTLDSSFNTLTYTKIGRQVTIIGMLKVASVSNPSGIFRAPLPFGRANQTQQGERTMGNIMVVGAAVNNMNEFATYPDGGVDSYLEIVSISGTTITRNGGQNMQANASIYVNYTYFTS